MCFDLFSILYFYWVDVSSLSPEVNDTVQERGSRLSQPIKIQNIEKVTMQEHFANSEQGGVGCVKIGRQYL